MHASRALPFLALLCACGDSARMLGPTTYVVAGAWYFEQSVADQAAQIACGSFGPLTVTQNGPRFTAQGTQSGSCSVAGSSESFTDEPFAIADGTIDGTAIAFHDDECTYTGTAFGPEPDSLGGAATCRIVIGSTAFTLRGTWHVIPPPDYVPPTVQAATFGGGGNGTFELGDDTIYVRIQAGDNTALHRVGYELTDPSRGNLVIRRDSIVMSDSNVTALDDTLFFPLPLSLILPVPDGTPFFGSAFAYDTAGNSASVALTPIVVQPPSPPVATGSVAGSTRPDTAAALRDTLDIQVSAVAPRELRYIGYRLTTVPGGDSIAVTSSSATQVFRVPVPFAWKGSLVRIEIFARDRLGLQDAEQVAELRVVVLPSRPTQTFRVGQGVGDLVYDAARERIYLMTSLDSTANAGQPEVRRFDFASGGFLPGIALPWFADGMDLSPGGDSLLLTAYNGRLGIVNLTTLALDSSDVIAFPPSSGYPAKVRAMANGKAIISITGGTSGQGRLVEYDLATGTQALRTDVGASGNVGPYPLLGRLADRTRLVVFPSHPTESRAQLYWTATDSVYPSQSVLGLPVGAVGISGRADAVRWLLGNVLVDSQLLPLRTFATAGSTGASVLSADGAFAYVAVPEGVAKFRTSDGVEVERILLQNQPYILSLTPDNNTLIAIGFGLQIVDLR